MMRAILGLVLLLGFGCALRPQPNSIAPNLNVRSLKRGQKDLMGET